MSDKDNSEVITPKQHPGPKVGEARGRPIETRSPQGYRQEVERLGRLRTALMLLPRDNEVDDGNIRKALDACDALVAALLPFMTA